ncbi:hypothetical protein NliqN6_3429 [Naganishia liquefaciens]|uniref:Uncharacterized protein n=1 Tax=Naganishia liquefaciens TaxID=104408 RepID=A0A8H3YGA3_9TREE|nr:hypothetical protein NliqN6_3429 [Naganishia liquefaciens]
MEESHLDSKPVPLFRSLKEEYQVGKDSHLKVEKLWTCLRKVYNRSPRRGSRITFLALGISAAKFHSSVKHLPKLLPAVPISVFGVFGTVLEPDGPGVLTSPWPPDSLVSFALFFLEAVLRSDSRLQR